jgi:hypothetical protein
VQGFQIHGPDWKTLSAIVATRTPDQLRSHHQKQHSLKAAATARAPVQALEGFMRCREKMAMLIPSVPRPNNLPSGSASDSGDKYPLLAALVEQFPDLSLSERPGLTREIAIYLTCRLLNEYRQRLLQRDAELYGNPLVQPPQQPQACRRPPSPPENDSSYGEKARKLFDDFSGNPSPINP